MTKMPSEGGYLLSRVHQLSGRVFNRLLLEKGIPINSGQGRILFVLLQDQGMPIQRLADRTSLSPSTLTSMLDRMEEDGLVERRRSIDDRRIILVFLGARALSLEERYLEVSTLMTEIFYLGFSREERKEFESFLFRIADNLESAEKDAIL